MKTDWQFSSLYISSLDRLGAADYQRIRSTEPPILGNNADTDSGAEFTTLQKHLSAYQEEFPDTVKAPQGDTYIDDIQYGSDKVEAPTGFKEEASDTDHERRGIHTTQIA